MTLEMKILKYLKLNLSANRYTHSLAVATCAQELAQTYGLNTETAYLAGLLHDVTKEMDLNEQNILLIDNPNFTAEIKQVKAVWHGYSGAVFVQKEFNITDVNIIEAIELHSVGNLGMSDIAKLIFIADFIEPNRNNESATIVRTLIGQDLDYIIYIILVESKKYLEAKGGSFISQTEQLYRLLEQRYH